MTDLAVFADGPLKGQAREIGPWARQGGWMVRTVPEPLAAALLPPLSAAGLLEYDEVQYRFREYAAWGRVILVGSVEQPPAGDDLFEVLLSDAAKQTARVVA